MSEKKLLTTTNILLGLVALTLLFTFRFGLELPKVKPRADCDDVGNAKVDVWALQARKVAADVWAWRTYQARLEQLTNASHFSCDGARSKLRGLDFSHVSPPVHYLPARGLTAHASIFAELQGRNTCDLLYPASRCNDIKTSATHWPDLWLQDFIDIALDGCIEEGSRCVALDIGSHLGLASLRMLQNGAKVVSFEAQPDLCCAGQNSAKINQYDGRAVYLCGQLGLESSTKDLAAWDSNWDAMRLGAELGTGGLKMGELYERLQVPSEVPVWRLQDIMTYPTQIYKFVKLDTDLDCEMLRVLLDMQRKGDISVSSLSFKAFSAGACSDDAMLIKLFTDLQSLGFTLYRAPAVYATQAIKRETGSEFYGAVDNYPQETEAEIPMESTTLLKLRNMSLQEWAEAPKLWRKTDFIIASTVEFVHVWPVHNEWNLQGRGCCWNGGEASRPSAVADMQVAGNWDVGLEACEAMCLKHPEECSLISYFPRTGWCTAWAHLGPCPNQLRSKRGDCGSDGHEVVTYTYSKTPGAGLR